jgi:hypothetical protein
MVKKSHTKKRLVRRGGFTLLKRKNALKDSDKPLTYKNLRYPDGGGVIPELKCLVCSNNTFYLRTLLNSGARNVKNLLIEGFMGETFIEKNFKLFACSKCGFQMHFSNKMQLI